MPERPEGQGKAPEEAGEEARRVAEAVALLHRATPRAWVTPLFGALLVVAFGVAVARGLHPLAPTGKQLLAAGADFGPSLLAGEWWRLWSSALVHVGVVHLLFNLWALWDAGRLAERIFGNAALAAILLLTAPAASLLQVAMKPLTVGAGASGAVFGVYGALLAFAVLGHEALPREMLQRQRNSLLGFLFYNLLYGLAAPGIGLAAHAGGLVAGMVAGWLFRRDLREPARGAGRRAAGALAMACALALGGWAVRERLVRVPAIRADLLADRCMEEVRTAGAEAARIEAALETCGRAIAADEGAAFLRLARAQLLLQAKRGEEALEEAGRAAAAEPDEWRPRAFRAQVLYRLGRLPEAEPDCAWLCRPETQDAPCPRTCVDVAAGRGARQLAEGRLALGLARRPDDVPLLRGRAASRIQAGDLDGALADLEQVLRQEPDNARALNSRAWIRVLRRDWAAALADSERSSKLEAESAPTLGTRCFALVGLGRREQARRDCARAVELNPASKVDRAMLAFLDGRRDEAVRLRREVEAASASDARALAPWLGEEGQGGGR